LVEIDPSIRDPVAVLEVEFGIRVEAQEEE
jgi:hypothetical protein